jgi:hypothetical protein
MHFPNERSTSEFQLDIKPSIICFDKLKPPEYPSNFSIGDLEMKKQLWGMEMKEHC